MCQIFQSPTSNIVQSIIHLSLTLTIVSAIMVVPSERLPHVNHPMRFHWITTFHPLLKINSKTKRHPLEALDLLLYL